MADKRDAPSAKLCTMCQHVIDHIHEADDDLRKDSSSDSGPASTPVHDFPWHSSFYQWMASVKNGCSFCTLFLHTFKEEDRRNCWSSWEAIVAGDSPINTSLSFRLSNASSVLSSCDRSCQAEIFVEPVQKWARVPLLRPKDRTVTILEGSTGSPSSLEMVKTWLHTCQTSHSECATKALKNSPMRLLELFNGKCRLYETREEIPPYVTLSHCWGKLTIVRLLKDNIAAFRDDIPLEDLSKTFRQAISMTSILGFKYIWIDSLCIIQDNENDWREQAALMSSVYGSASLNLAATHALDGSYGLFHDRDPSKTIRQVVRSLNGEVIELVDEFPYQRCVVDGPLNSRAWVYQERFLAHRTLHFSSEQLFWECRKEIKCESFPEGIPEVFHRPGLLDRAGITQAPFGGLEYDTLKAPTSAEIGAQVVKFLGMLHPEDTRPNDGIKGDATDGLNPLYLASRHSLDSWPQVVNIYSAAQLTYVKDKLIAISGVARNFKSRNNDSYIAGLWEKNLELQLCWRVNIHLEQNIVQRNSSNGTVYQAPSWSWASIDRPVTWHLFTTNNIMLTEGVIRHVRVIEVKIEPAPGDKLAQLSSGNIKLADRDEFAQPSSGYLKLCVGSLIACHMFMGLMDEPQNRMFRGTGSDEHALPFRDPQNIIQCGRIWFDKKGADYSAIQDKLYYMIVAREDVPENSAGDRFYWWGLIVTPSETNQKHFKRLGLFDIAFKTKFGSDEVLKLMDNVPTALLDEQFYDKVLEPLENGLKQYIITLI